MAYSTVAPIRGEYQNYTNIERDKRLHKLAVYSSIANTGSFSKTFDHGQHEILFSNDADKETPPLQLDTSMTVTLYGADDELYMQFRVYYGEVLDERINGFDKITIEGNYAWRLITRSTVVI